MSEPLHLFDHAIRFHFPLILRSALNHQRLHPRECSQHLQRGPGGRATCTTSTRHQRRPGWGFDVGSARRPPSFTSQPQGRLSACLDNPMKRDGAAAAAW